MAAVKRQPRVRRQPRVSLNGLAEYLTATAARRRRIVGDQKRPSEYQVVYYREVEKALRACLTSPTRDMRPLDAAVRKLQSGRPAKQWEIARRETGVEAINAFRQFLADQAVDWTGIVRTPRDLPYLSIGPVSVSVFPDALFSDGDSVRGGLRLYLSKSRTLAEERAKYTGTILHQFIETVLGGGQRVDYRRCLILDVFAKKVWTAPRTFRRRRTDVEAACEEIALVWSSV